jgi:hypothetical protein
VSAVRVCRRYRSDHPNGSANLTLNPPDLPFLLRDNDGSITFL